MTSEFEFEFEGEKVYTGMKMPEEYPVSFKPYPETHVRPLDEILDILDSPDRVPARQRWGQGKLINQGRRSSCNAYMAAAMWMRSNFYATGKWVDVSPEFLYMHINGGQDNGSMLDDGMKFMTDVGICRRKVDGEQLIPYQSYRKNKINMETLRFATQDAANQKAGECYQMPKDSPESCWHALLSCLAGRGTVGLAVHVGRNYMRSGKIAGYDRGHGNHAVAGDDIVKLTESPNGVEDLGIVSPQSWGPNFADGGFTIITIKHISGTMKYHGLYGLRSVLTNPSDVSLTRIK
jgi:hypothetical protein|tara:strand:+ start:7087 stop:7962 length:876 start_codon:yes stop_codon:yes gene_type:complete